MESMFDSPNSCPFELEYILDAMSLVKYFSGSYYLDFSSLMHQKVKIITASDLIFEI